LVLFEDVFLIRACRQSVREIARLCRPESGAQVNQSKIEEQVKRRTSELEASEVRFCSVIETAGSAIVGLHADHRIFEWNQEAERVFGYSRSECMGRDFFELALSASHHETDGCGDPQGALRRSQPTATRHRHSAETGPC